MVSSADAEPARDFNHCEKFEILNCTVKKNPAVYESSVDLFWVVAELKNRHSLTFPVHLCVMFNICIASNDGCHST